MSRLVSGEELLELLNSNTKLIFIAKILLKLFFSNLLHPSNKLKVPAIVLSNGNVLKITLIHNGDIFSTSKKEQAFFA